MTQPSLADLARSLLTLRDARDWQTFPAVMGKKY